MTSLRNSLRQRIRGLSGRSRAIGMFFATSVAARGLGIACQLIQVPIAMSALGTEAFGLWMTLTGIGAVIAFADFGVGQGAQNKLAEAFAAGQSERARELWDSTLVFFGAVALLLTAVFMVLVPSTNFSQLFGLREAAVQREAGAAVAVMLGVFCLNFPFGLAQRLAYSRQKGWMHNVALAAGSVGGLLGTVVAIQLRWSLPFVILAAQVPVLIGNAVLMFRQLVELRWTDVFRARPRWATMRELTALGACFGIQQMQLTLFVALPQVIISTHLGAAAVTPYNLGQRLFNLFAVIQNAFMTPLWPAYSEAKAKGDFEWVRRTLRTSIGATLACTLLPMGIGAAFAHPIISAWVGSDAALPSTALVWLMFTWNALVFIGQPFGYMLAGLSEVRRLTQYAVVSAILSTVLMAMLVSRYGAEGVVAGMALGFLPFLLRANIAEALLALRRFPRPQANPELLSPTPAVETRGWR
jgi:O-antigen/teichoic acid export membrane protein